MNDLQKLIIKNVETNKQLILDAERWLWAHPQTGYTEWAANGYRTERPEARVKGEPQAADIPDPPPAVAPAKSRWPTI